MGCGGSDDGGRRNANRKERTQKSTGQEAKDPPGYREFKDKFLKGPFDEVEFEDSSHRIAVQNEDYDSDDDDNAPEPVFVHRCISKQRDKINYFFGIKKHQKSRMAFGLAEIDIDFDGVADGDTISRSSHSSASESDDEARSIGSEDSLEDAPEVLNMWRAKLWRGEFQQINEDGDVRNKAKLKVDKKHLGKDALKGSGKGNKSKGKGKDKGKGGQKQHDGAVVTLQLDKGKMSIWVDKVFYGVVTTDQSMSNNKVRPFV